MYQILAWIPTIYITIDILRKLFVLFSGNSKLKITSILISAGFLLYMYAYFTAGVDTVYRLFEIDDLQLVGQITGAVAIPLGYIFARWLVQRMIRVENMQPETRKKFEATMSFVVYPIVPFLLFFVSYLVIGIVVQTLS